MTLEARLPFVSVVLPIRNEARYIEACLAAVAAQDYPPHRMEVLVVDGMSTDDTRERVLRFAENRARTDGAVGDRGTSLPHITLLDNPAGIVPTALNIAIREARGEIIVRVDGHCEIAPDYVRNCVQHLQSGQWDGVGGPIETVGMTATAGAIALAMSSAFGVGGSAFRTVKDRAMEADTIPFPAYTREAIERTGPFDEELVRNQDDEYNYRLRKLGGRLLLTPDIRSRYYSRSSLRTLWRQYFQYGYWKVRVMQKHPRQMSLRQFVPAAFVGGLLAGALGAAVGVAGPALPGSVAASYLAANLGASVWTAAQHGFRHLKLLPVVYATLHLSYGLGFLVGLVRFAGRWGERVEG